MAESPPPLYHGTRTGFRGRGGLLAPRTSHKSARVTSAPLKPGRSAAPDSEQFVYVTADKVLAWVYAWCSTGRGKPRVLTVRPLSDVWPDPEHSPDMGAYRCEAAIVENVDFEPLVTEEEARAGWVVDEDPGDL